ncbi:MAG TPA: DUF3466 family protein [Gemmataceae bacterium]|jgi:probable HAF family extracellular repeat protein
MKRVIFGVLIVAMVSFPSSAKAEYVVTDLGTFGGTVSSASGINDAGQVVGTATTSDNTSHAFLYSNGTMTDLNSLLPSNSGFSYLVAATAINDNGQIVGYGLTTSGQYDAFLLTPETDVNAVPEPASVTMLGIGIVSMLGYGWLRRKRAALDQTAVNSFQTKTQSLTTC